MSQSHISVSVFCQYKLDRAGLEALLASLPGLQILPFDSSSHPQVLIFQSGEDNFTPLPELSPKTAVLILVSGGECPELASNANLGVIGFFSKNETAEALSIAIRQLARGEAYLSPALALSILQRKRTQKIAPQVEWGSLTEREREVLALLADGLSNKAIAARLYLSVRTIDGHLANLYSRLGVHSRTEAMLQAIQYLNR